jgi:23S rRNA (uracil-5-)-methyltransferase RumA
MTRPARPAAPRGTSSSSRVSNRGPRIQAVRTRGPGWLRSGQKVMVTFRKLAVGGAAVGVAGGHTVTVPFGAPGESAVIEIVRGGPDPVGKIISLLRRSPQTQRPPCRHFGVCGGCQWQHLAYESQLQHKAALVREVLAPVLAGAPGIVRDVVGSDPWSYRDRLQASVAMRGDRLVAGFHVSAGGLRVINVRECPIQYSANVGALDATRAALVDLGWPVFDPAGGRGLIRGFIVQHAFQTDEVMVVLSAVRDIPDHMAAVRSIRDRVPELRSLMLSIAPRRRPDLLGRLQLLWGRDYLEDEVAGVRVRRYPTASMPPNAGAMPAWVEAVAAALGLDGSETVLDTACEEGFMPVALARSAGRIIGIARDRTAMHRAWDTAARNGVTTCVFYTRAPERVIEKLYARGERLDAALVASRENPAGRGLFDILARSGARRLAITASSLPLLAADLRTAAGVGYQLEAVRPVDLLPQTSRIHCVAALARA